MERNPNEDPFIRTKAMIGLEAFARLEASRVAVFGVGGVGSYVAEALVRTGIGQIDIIDNDRVCPSNLNRQIMALHSTLGMAKVQVMARRMQDINPTAKVTAYETFVDKTTMEIFPFESYDYIVDAIDTVASKLLLIEKAKMLDIPVISSMGVGNKLYPERLTVTDISKTQVCPLARVMRRELKKRGIYHVKVLFSDEEPVDLFSDPGSDETALNRKRRSPGSIAFVPSVAGLIIAGEVVRDLSGIPQDRKMTKEAKKPR